ncbi:MAG TPA: YcgN family cysteine cluster protein [Caulobacterales bacterium]|nr:YcgN family cysteine cluster protein [Caulobacterales bacterium]
MSKSAPKGEQQPFWKTKSLAEMNDAEWESLCDGCGKCCLVGLEDEDTGEIYLTDVACKLFDSGACRCGDYANRQKLVHDCVKLTPENVPELNWLPKTCAYRLVAQGRELFWWHPLVSGDPETVHQARVSVRGKTRPEGRLKIPGLMRRITKWPEPLKRPTRSVKAVRKESD